MFLFQISLFIPHFLFLLLPPLGRCQFLSPPSVSTSQGIYLPNTNVPEVDQFLGIPYAQPPLGPLRFAPPAPYTLGSPRTITNATTYGPACLQDRALEKSNGLSEDCLTLNIFRPATGHKRPQPLLPVLVFIYGGANLGGQSQHYHAQNLVAHALHNTATPVVAVTLNYRTGYLGFGVNTLFAARGLLNTGLMDQRAALQWLQNHIARFGGDPAKITLFGQSSGKMVFSPSALRV
ncbi:Carboxylesterase type B [Macrophomina phaseolina MS6]|uniref:Carboxylic ester hydrolase n=1 Tax=Macrophomina phaseolina (strain MS6) TaxID=1126212 RepID=K2RCH3_MACPH|nr:Carboxylesterase type B [Macrophomina phaseolina MS6]